MSEATDYEADFYAWTNEQAALLRAGKLGAADVDNIAEELESMGRSEKRELVNRLVVLLAHLLKWQFQPRHRGASWEATIKTQRLDVADHLAENPSLKSTLDVVMTAAYKRARISAAGETGLSESAFPVLRPWTWAQIMNEEFWPET